MPDEPRPEARRKVGWAAATWGTLALGGILIVAALALWHLIRRGRLIREGLSPPRDVRLPEPPGPAREPDAR